MKDYRQETEDERQKIRDEELKKISPEQQQPVASSIICSLPSSVSRLLTYFSEGFNAVVRNF